MIFRIIPPHGAPEPLKNKEKIGFMTPRGSRSGAAGPRSDFEKIKKIDFF